MTVLRPTTAGDVAAHVAEAVASGAPLEVVGTRTRRGIGRPVAARATLSLAALTGIVDYDPGELVLTARAGTPMAEIAAAVAAAGQYLACEPPDLAPLWGGAPGAGTIGGMLAVGWGGPRRPWAGAPRDHFLGFEAVNGAGEVFTAGGKVIKNVTGYDLPKLLAGSFGTLAVLTEVTIKTLPAPRATVTVALPGLDDAAAIAAMTLAAASRVGVTGAAHVPARADGMPATTLVRLEGVPGAIDSRAAHVVALVAGFGRAAVVAGDGDRATVVAADWAAIGAVHPFVPADAALWRVVVPATAAAAFVARLPLPLSHYYDWGGGLVWVALPGDGDAGAGAVRAALGDDGHATLVRADARVRSQVAPFQPLAPALAALEERVRARFDPARVLNPGRRVAA